MSEFSDFDPEFGPDPDLFPNRWRNFPAPIDYYPRPMGGGDGNGIIEYVIQSLTTESSGPYTGLKKATVVIKCGKGVLIGDTVFVYDHSNDLFTETSMTGYTGWAFWGQAWSLSAGAPCETLTPYHWIACNRVCSPNTGIYAEECP